ncbi:MAG TPA: DUF6316 family protein [Pseudomonas sp.]|nr:DUF6316 family protein [Pseudomonas sp.]
MYQKRQSDQATTIHFRTHRVGTVNGQYFFATREGTLEGPFLTRQAAQQGADGYVDRLLTRQQAQPARQS